ncbi:hypothetical protein T265_08374 [Opisthorchis viverrini]|uniref:Uncharacterized protein n=1 Tax=Opisthorchis viverrini TaxID=6198 RepID=A0A075A8L2_OPIVI|nr:hypothetical protein T265_08374 [Opisthorchis viverrini]KER23829.1 hypothetical protein T265_08374 [Opisthorchis viverrini]
MPYFSTSESHLIEFTTSHSPRNPSLVGFRGTFYTGPSQCLHFADDLKPWGSNAIALQMNVETAKKSLDWHLPPNHEKARRPYEDRSQKGFWDLAIFKHVLFTAPLETDPKRIRLSTDNLAYFEYTNEVVHSRRTKGVPLIGRIQSHFTGRDPCVEILVARACVPLFDYVIVELFVEFGNKSAKVSSLVDGTS